MSKLEFSSFMDLHNHTIWSDGDDTPEEIILNAIHHQVEVVGITDHFCSGEKYSIEPGKLQVYLNKLKTLKMKYNDKIKVYIGVEIAYSYLLRNVDVLPYDKLNQLDYVLLEDIDYIPAATKLEDVTYLLEGFKCSKGLAHTDLIKVSEKYDGKLNVVLDFLKRNELFWEINTNSAHDVFLNILGSYKDERTEQLMNGLVTSEIPVTVGSDTHSIVQYDYGRLQVANEVARKLNRL